MNIGPVEVMLSTGERIPLSNLYQDSKLVLVFLRHCGCVFSKDQVAQLRVHSALNVAFVMMSPPEQTAAFKENLRSPHTFLSDPDRALYKKLGLTNGGAKEMFGPKVWSRGFGAVLRGHFVGLPIGDPFQMPGVFAIEKDGEISWTYVSKDASDNPENKLIIEQLG